MMSRCGLWLAHPPALLKSYATTWIVQRVGLIPDAIKLRAPVGGSGVGEEKRTARIRIGADALPVNEIRRGFDEIRRAWPGAGNGQVEHPIRRHPEWLERELHEQIAQIRGVGRVAQPR